MHNRISFKQPTSSTSSTSFYFQVFLWSKSLTVGQTHTHAHSSVAYISTVGSVCCQRCIRIAIEFQMHACKRQFTLIVLIYNHKQVINDYMCWTRFVCVCLVDAAEPTVLRTECITFIPTARCIRFNVHRVGSATTASRWNVDVVVHSFWFSSFFQMCNLKKSYNSADARGYWAHVKNRIYRWASHWT